jgi:lysophospholipase L1-like esterase
MRAEKGDFFMKLNLSQIKDITLGAVRIEEIEGNIHFYRFTKEQEELYRNRNNDFYSKTFSTSGVQMRFRTNSQSLFLSVDTERGSTRKYFSVEVFVNGKRIDAIKNFSEEELVGNFTKWEFPLGSFSKEFALGEGEKEVRVYFPWSVKTVLKEFVLDDGASIAPVKPSKQLLCFGDSISHGYDVLYPSNKYLTKLADVLDAEEHNKAIGGEIYFPELAKTKEDFEPDYIIVEYGSNDWSKRTQEEVTHNCREFLCNVSKNYPNAKIFATTPIWRKDMHDVKPFGDFMRVEEIIQEQAAGLENISVIRGFEFVPQDVSLFSDLKLHPSDKGYEYFLKNLLKGMKM